jgi:hypothetical protein
MPFNPRVAWSADGLRLATNHFDDMIRVWDGTAHGTQEARAARRRAVEERAFSWHLQELDLARKQGDAAAVEWHRERLRQAEPPTPFLRLARGLRLAVAKQGWEATRDFLKGVWSLLLEG